MNETEWNQSMDLRRESDFQDTETLEAVQSAPVLDQLARQVDRLASPEDVLKKVIEASEHTLTTEKTLERRHEVKDIAASHNEKATYASRLSDILATDQAYAGLQTNMSPMKAGPSKTGIQSVLKGNGLYSHAIRYGFVSAICALIVAIIAVALFT